MVSRPDRLNYTSWLNVMLLAEYHDRLERKDSENDDGPARLDLRNTSIVLNGKLFTDEKVPRHVNHGQAYLWLSDSPCAKALQG